MVRVRVLAESFIPDDQEAEIEFANESAALLRFTTPLNAGGKVIEYVVAEIRHEGDSFNDLKEKKPLLCNVTVQSIEKAKSSSPLDLSWWRGGNTAITTLILL